MAEPAPILRVTVGSPVYTQDGPKIGKVKDVRGQAFQVETGLLRRDYWLSSDCIEQAVPEDAVVLSVEQSDLDTYKLSEPPEANAA